MVFRNEPGVCLRCGEDERDASVNALDEVIYSHVCKECQAECEAYFPCLICEREIYEREPTLSESVVLAIVESDELCICLECHRKIKLLLAQGYSPRRIACNYRGDGHSREGRIQQICEAVKIGRENWIAVGDVAEVAC